MRGIIRAAAVAAAAVAVLAIVSPAAARTRVVTPGHSIQHAINQSHPGDTILVEDGRYRESLDIGTDRLTIRGEDADDVILVPPSSPSSLCDTGGGPPGQITGICVHGQVASTGGPPQVTRNVQKVRIAGLTVRGFSGDGVFIFGGQKTLLKRMHLDRNGGYGAFSNTSRGTRYIDNLVTHNSAPGLYIGDSPHANSVVRDNVSVGNHGEGLLLRSATGGRVSDNVFEHNCAGILVLADAPGPAGSWILERNSADENNRACAGEADQGEPPISGIGIGVLGASHTRVRDNTVVGNRALHQSIAHGGIVIGRGDPNGTAPAHDSVKDNTLASNSPFDIDWDGSGSVTFRRNDCDRSRPGGICH